jgi:oligoribonuclease NrnB/cAMP/cGMP phosphodiesterase (DHH superfamily)
MPIMNIKSLINPQDVQIIVYHAHCPDGAASAFCAYSKLGDSVAYLPCSYHKTDRIFEIAEGKNLLFLDFSLKRDSFIKLQSIANSVMVLDHHLTAQTELRGLEGVHIELEKCGTSLTWEFFNSEIPPPKFIEYVEDVDLWRWEKQDSYYFSLGFYNILKENDFDFRVISNIFSDDDISKMIRTGYNIFSSFEYRIKEACNHISIVNTKLNNQPVTLGFIECDRDILNDIAIFALANMRIDGLILSYKYNENQNKFSLRRLRGNNKIAMHKIAELFSGGGHAHAASFLSPNSAEQILKLLLNKFSE